MWYDIGALHRMQMTRNIFFIVLIASAITFRVNVKAQSTPGNGGTLPGNSNGGSGIEIQPTINPNSLVKPKQDLHAYTGPNGSTGTVGTTGMTGATGNTCPASKSLVVKTSPYCPAR